MVDPAGAQVGSRVFFICEVGASPGRSAGMDFHDGNSWNLTMVGCCSTP